MIRVLGHQVSYFEFGGFLEHPIAGAAIILFVVVLFCILGGVYFARSPKQRSAKELYEEDVQSAK